MQAEFLHFMKLIRNCLLFFVISGCSIYLIMNEIDPKLLPVPYIYSRPPIMEFVGNIKRADRPKGSTRKFYYIPEN